jgi:hypothetical protein
MHRLSSSKGRISSANRTHCSPNLTKTSITAVTEVKGLTSSTVGDGKSKRYKDPDWRSTEIGMYTVEIWTSHRNLICAAGLRSNPSNLVSIILSRVCQILTQPVSGNGAPKKWISNCDWKANEKDGSENEKNIALKKKRQVTDDRLADDGRKVCLTGIIGPFRVIIFAVDHSSMITWFHCFRHRSTFALRDISAETHSCLINPHSIFGR